MAMWLLNCSLFPLFVLHSELVYVVCGRRKTCFPSQTNAHFPKKSCCVWRETRCVTPGVKLESKEKQEKSRSFRVSCKQKRGLRYVNRFAQCPFLSSFFVFANEKKGHIFASGNNKQCIAMVLEISISRKEYFSESDWVPAAVMSNMVPHQAWGCTEQTDLHQKALVFGLKQGTLQSGSEKNNLKNAQHQHVRILHCTSSQSLVDSNLFGA